MNISIHLITSLILTAILWPFIGPYSLWAIVGGYLIDFDHYIHVGFKFGKWNLRDSYHFHIQYLCKKAKKNREILHIFHTVEFLVFMVIMILFAYLNEWRSIFYMFAITLIGMAMHIILDLIGGIIKNNLQVRAISIIWWINKFLINKENSEQ